MSQLVCKDTWGSSGCSVVPCFITLFAWSACQDFVLLSSKWVCFIKLVTFLHLKQLLTERFATCAIKIQTPACTLLLSEVSPSYLLLFCSINRFSVRMFPSLFLKMYINFAGNILKGRNILSSSLFSFPLIAGMKSGAKATILNYLGSQKWKATKSTINNPVFLVCSDSYVALFEDLL